MRILKGILKESKEYYQKIEHEILKRLKSLPKGSIKRRTIKGHIYYYVQFRKGTKIIQIYLGKVKPMELERKIVEREKLKRELKETRQSLKLLNKVKNA